jgi:hypothetical protein
VRANALLQGNDFSAAEQDFRTAIEELAALAILVVDQPVQSTAA